MIPLILLTGVIAALWAVFMLNTFFYKYINNHIDKKFKEGFYKETNWFMRLFISKKKISSLNHEHTDGYRRMAASVLDIITVVIVIALIGFASGVSIIMSAE